jgi:antitoxin component of RelBE/YafQ-DinJ toxin-antitoxin module
MEKRFVKGGPEDVTDLFVFVCEEILHMRWVDAKRKYLNGQNARSKTVTLVELARVIEKSGLKFELTVHYEKEPTLKEIREERLSAIRGPQDKEEVDSLHQAMQDQAKDIEGNEDIVPDIPGEIKIVDPPDINIDPANMPDLPSFMR